MKKEEVIKILESNETFNEVLNIIKHECHIRGTQFDEVPVEHFICGGAVANTIYYILNKGKLNSPTINDVDVFSFNYSEDYFHDYSQSSLQKEIQQISLDNTVGSDYAKYFITSFGEQITMKSSEVDGIINKIFLDVFHHNKEYSKDLDKYYLGLINTFDLNCCMAGINRVSKKIVYTDEFVDFILRDMIEVTSLKHPVQTAYRMKKKSTELKTITKNFDSEMSLLREVLKFENGGRLAVGNVWLSRINQDSKLFSENFVWVTPREGDDMVFMGEEGLTYYKVNPDFNSVKIISSIESLYGGTITNLLKWDKKSLLVIWDLFFRDKHNDDIKNKLHEFIFQPKIKRRNISLRLSLLRCLKLSKNYFDCEFNLRDLNRVHGFITYLHINRIQPDIFFVDNVKNQIEVMDYFKKKFVRDGLFREMYFSKVYERIVNKRSVEEDLLSTSLRKKLSSFDFGIKNHWFLFNTYKIKHQFVTDKSFINFSDLGEESIDF